MTARLLGILLGAGLTALVADSASARPSPFEIGMQALEKGDFAEAYCRWKPLAEQGSADAQYHLGWLYANGNGLAVDVARALEWWRMAASKGHADAQFAVALAYTTGEGIETDLEEAVRWYLAAAEQGHQDARDILVRLNGDPALDLAGLYPELAEADWFGWRATVKGDRINVRKGPGTQHAVAMQLSRGTEVRVIGSRGDWYLIVLPDARRDGAVWIYKTLVSRVAG